LAVVGGEVRWSKAGDDLWWFERTKNGYTIRVLGGKWDDWYLTYDPDGKGKALFLSGKPKPGSYWEVNGLYGMRACFIHATAGAVKGWQPDRGEEVQRVKGADGKLHRAYRALLAERPQHIKSLKSILIAP
jgi:hypothetical protein